jgi:hypothetical protein
MLLMPDEKGYFVRVPETKNGAFEWSDRRLKPAPCAHPVAVAPKLTFDEIRFAAVKQAIKRVDDVWEMDLPVLPMPIMERERPYFPRMNMIADRKSGYILCAEPLDPHSPDGGHERVLAKLIEIFEQTKLMPKRVHFRSRSLRSALNYALSRMGIETQFVRELPAIEEAFASMLGHFGG